MLGAIITAILTVVCAYITRGEWFIAGTILVLGTDVCALMLMPRYGSEGG